jgi:hypothetical protein
MKATLSDDLAAAGSTFGTWELGDMARRPGGPLTRWARLPMLLAMNGLNHICGICREIIR